MKNIPLLLAVLFAATNCNAWGVVNPGKPAVDYTAVKELKGSSDWQAVSVKLNELFATDPKSAAPLANWQTITEFSISPKDEIVKAGQKVKVDGKAWQGPKKIRKLRWEGGEYARQRTADSALGPEEFQKNFNDAIKKSLEQEKLEGKQPRLHRRLKREQQKSK